MNPLFQQLVAQINMKESLITSSIKPSNSTDIISPTMAMSLALKTETVSSTITTSIDSSYNSGMSTANVSAASNSIESITKVSSVTPTSVHSSVNIRSSITSLSITPLSAQTETRNNTHSSSSTDTSVSTIITSSTRKPITSLIQTHNPTQSTPLDMVTVTKVTSTILTSTSKVETKGWWIFFLIMNLLINDDGSKKCKGFQKFIKTSQKSSFHDRFFQHYYFKIDRKGTRKHRRGKEQSKIK